MQLFIQSGLLHCTGIVPEKNLTGWRLCCFVDRISGDIISVGRHLSFFFVSCFNALVEMYQYSLIYHYKIKMIILLNLTLFQAWKTTVFILDHMHLQQGSSVCIWLYADVANNFETMFGCLPVFFIDCNSLMQLNAWREEKLLYFRGCDNSMQTEHLF